MYLAIMLIIVAVLVVYNEVNKTMNIAEIALLVVALIAIIRASLNYINLDDTINIEGFANKSFPKNSNKSKGKNHMDDIIVLESTKSKEYFDTDPTGAGEINLDDNNPNSNPKNEKLVQPSQPILSSLNKNKIDKNAVNEINSILGIQTPSKNIDSFSNVTKNTIKATTTTSKVNNDSNQNNGIESVFVPEIKIGKGASDALGVNLNGMSMNLGVLSGNSLASSAAGWGSNSSGDGMSFKNSMKPVSNLWKSNLDYMDTSTNWSQSLNDFNNGKWNPKLYSNPSDYIDFYNPSAYGMNTPSSARTTSSPQSSSKANNTTIPQTTMGNVSNFEDIPNSTSPMPTTLNSYGQSQKLCGAYDDLALDQAGNLVVKNYTQAKKWYPGYTYVPPVYWDVPQRHVSVCQGTNPDARKLTGLIDRGLPLNVLELNPNGSMADTEESVNLTNVGSMLPKFTYQEMPFSKPYV
jgi:hypothetical protein